MTVGAGERVADLVRRARNPRAPVREQHAAFALLVERFEAMAFGTALRACPDPETARDAGQEAFLAAWRLLPRLREPAAFGGWLKRLVRTQCARARRRGRAAAARDPAEVAESASDPAELAARDEVVTLIRRAVSELPARERDAVTRFYFLGESLREVARMLGMTVAGAGKCVYVARLELRRRLPRTIAEESLAARPGRAFARRVQAGVCDEFAGEYRFAKRPDHRVILRRERDVLVCYAGGQRNVLASRAPDTLAPTEFDGEGRFRRDRHGRIRDFIYYEFGRRVAVAVKAAGGA
jgi:RNA polymerase sigma-70 factor (ECF subfamily)